MNAEQFTRATTELFNSSINLAHQYKNPALEPIHLFAAGLTTEFIKNFLTSLNIKVNELELLVKEALNNLPKVTNAQLVMSDNLEKFFNQCLKEAEELGDKFISLEVVILVFTEKNYLPTTIENLLKNLNFSRSRVLEHIRTLRKGRTVTEKNAEQQYEILDKYCQNITQMARSGKLDPVIGRHEEIRRVIQILSRRTKNNPILIGEPGVGKTAIVEGIAQRIINHDVPENLRDNEIYALDLGLLLAGTKFQGEFEERIKGILKEVEANPSKIILFIDEIHMLVGAGGAGGGTDASNLLKPALARGVLHCIGATTLAEYKKYIEKDAALERRFQKVLVMEPTEEDALSILRGLKERYELHHGVRIKDQALVAAVKLSSKNIAGRFLPDKAIDLVDEAAASVRMAIDSQPEEIDQLERRIRQLEIEKLALEKEKSEESIKRLKELEKELEDLKEKQKSLISKWKAEKEPLEKTNKLKEQIEQEHIRFLKAEREGDFAKASEIKYGKLVQLQQKLDEEQKKLTKVETSLIKEEVNEQDIAHVLSRWTGIPAEKLQASESHKLLNMANILHKKVIGQNEAIEEVTHAIQMHRTGLTDPNRPIGSFLFLGPTGVGKTEVARTLADFLFDDPDRLIRIDMSEYMEKHAVARLIGAPPGYVGYEEGGQLTEAVRRNPYSVVLFDEVEKAHPDVFNLFLQILDEGRLTDSQGRTVSFKNCIIIMTSNIGSDIILASPEITDSVKESINKLLYKNFRPEFLNRIDAIVFFKRLSHADVEEIAKIQVSKLQKRLSEKNIELSISKEALSKIADLGYEPEFGARPLKRAIQHYITIPISQKLLKEPNFKHIDITVQKDEIQVSNK